MRNRTSVIFSGLGIIALLALAPDPAAARGGFGGFHGGGIGGFRGGGFSGVRAGSFGGARAAMVPMGGMRAAAIGRPGWGGAVVRPGWSGAVRPGWGVGWRRGWGGGGWDGVGQLQLVSQPASLWLVLGAGAMEATVRTGTVLPG